MESGGFAQTVATQHQGNLPASPTIYQERNLPRPQYPLFPLFPQKFLPILTNPTHPLSLSNKPTEVNREGSFLKPFPFKMAASTAQDVKEDQQNLSYILQHDMHHVFERLAGEVLQEKPAELLPFLIGTLQKMHDSTKPAPKTESNPTPAPEPTPTPTPTPPTAEPEVAKEAKPYDPTEEDRRPIDGVKEELLKITVAVFGIGNAGKTTLLSALSGEVDTETTPTVGFTPIRMRTDRIDLQLYDLGGGKRIRSVWQNYYADVHGVVYVVDASADEDDIKESVEEFLKVLEDERITGKPICIMANKQDLSTKPLENIADYFKLKDLKNVHIVATCAIDPKHEKHVNIEVGMQWILEKISERYQELSVKVKEQVAIQKAKNKARMQEVVCKKGPLFFIYRTKKKLRKGPSSSQPFSCIYCDCVPICIIPDALSYISEVHSPQFDNQWRVSCLQRLFVLTNMPYSSFFDYCVNSYQFITSHHRENESQEKKNKNV